MKLLVSIVLIFCLQKTYAYDSYIITTQQQITLAKTAQEKITAYEKWLPLAILIHHPNTKKDLDDFNVLAKEQNSLLANGIYNLNMAYYLVENYGDYNTGLDFCMKATSTFEKLNAKPQLVMAYNRLAFLVLWNQAGKKDLIVKENINDKYLSKALTFSKELKDKNLEILTLSFIGSYFSVTESSNPKSLNYFFDAEKLLDEQTPPDLKLVILESISIVYAYLYDEKNALLYLNKCESFSFFQAFGYGRSNMYRSIATMYLKNPAKPNFKKALDYANKAYTISLAMNAPEYISRGENLLFEIYKAMGNEKMALQFHEKYKLHEDSLGRERFQRTYADYDVVKKEATIKTLENDKLKQANDRKNLIGWGLIFTILSGGVFGIYVFKNNKKLKQKNEELFQKNEEIGKALITGQNIERKRVAADLHDSLGVQANSILYNAELLKNEAEGKESRIDFLHETAKEMLLNLRETLWAMKSNDIAAIDLWLRIVNFCQQMSRHYKNIHIATEGLPPSNFLLESPKALHIVMIIQEAVNNALKHSEASSIIINSNLNDKNWHITIADNGKGFTTTNNAKTDSYGLTNMKERALAAGIKLNMSSNHEKGTLIELIINTDNK
jgi:two-component system, NarL family, sensor kinase